MKNNHRHVFIIGTCVLAMILVGIVLFNTGYLSFTGQEDKEYTDGNVIVLRVCNWEEYIDEGDWDEEEVIDLESGDIFGESAVYDEFCDWYYEQTGVRVVIEYSCFGTNEELYNMLTLGDEYDLVCPSEYMIMKLMSEGWLLPYSDEFFDEEKETNYYINNVSPFIRETFDTHEINGNTWSEYAAGYMWGVTGILYNPDEVSAEQVSTWTIMTDSELYRKITVKDNVRDTLFAAIGAVNRELLTSEEFVNDPNYKENLEEVMNDVSPEMLAKAEAYLKDVKDNVYSFETDSGKADMITGKVWANYQWSGDAVYAMDQAEEDDYYLEFCAPDECTNLWFDGWVMLKNGIGSNSAKQAAAEAFVNYLSRPDNAVRNMYYIGYTSVIAGNEDDTRVFEYLEWNYSAEEDEEDVVEYPVGYFFSGDEEDEDYIIIATEEQTRRQLYAQYPPSDVIERSSIMRFFDSEANARANQLWINIRCFSITEVPAAVWVVLVLVIAGSITAAVVKKKNRPY